MHDQSIFEGDVHLKSDILSLHPRAGPVCFPTPLPGSFLVWALSVEQEMWDMLEVGCFIPV